jgi:hypothetical protein
MSGGTLADGVPAQYAAPVVLTPTTWTGLYVGVQGGYAESDIDWTLPVAQFFGAAGRGFSADDEDVVLGGHATYMYQMGPFVVGEMSPTTRRGLKTTSSAPFLLLRMIASRPASMTTRR